MMMKTDKNYRPPMILKEVSVQLERDLLENSLVDKALVTSPGQEVETLDFNSDYGKTEFSHEWE